MAGLQSKRWPDRASQHVTQAYRGELVLACTVSKGSRCAQLGMPRSIFRQGLSQNNAIFKNVIANGNVSIILNIADIGYQYADNVQYSGLPEPTNYIGFRVLVRLIATIRCQDSIAASGVTPLAPSLQVVLALFVANAGASHLALRLIRSRDQTCVDNRTRTNSSLQALTSSSSRRDEAVRRWGN
jgi:hypothetical protein